MPNQGADDTSSTYTSAVYPGQGLPHTAHSCTGARARASHGQTRFWFI